jgi:hypothetical protein
MKTTIALALLLAVCAGAVHAEDKKADAKKSEKKAEKKSAGKSDKNAFQKAESDIGHWARKNKIWGTPRPGD